MIDPTTHHTMSEHSTSELRPILPHGSFKLRDIQLRGTSPNVHWLSKYLVNNSRIVGYSTYRHLISSKYPIKNSGIVGFSTYRHLISSKYQEGRKEMFYLTTYSTHFIYGYMASDIWLRTILIVKKETRCCHIGYSFRLTARVLLYAPSHRQENTYHSLCYTSHKQISS